MIKQNAFISSSSSSTHYVWRDRDQKWSWNSYYVSNPLNGSYNTTFNYAAYTQTYSNYSNSAGYSWDTYKSTAYERIQYFLNSVQKTKQTYNSNNEFYQSLANYSNNTSLPKQLWKGFVDVVITFPSTVRLAGIQLLNTWINSTTDSSYWRYLPTKFNIYKVNDGTNDLQEEITYQTDVARTPTPRSSTQSQYNLISYYDRQNTDNLTLLGKYDNISWANLSSYKCFFKYNPEDSASINTKNTSTAGTATWKCKQIVLRIFKTTKSSQDTDIISDVAQFIASQENSYGTTVGLKDVTTQDAKLLIGQSDISSTTKPTGFSDWSFGGNFTRSYDSFKSLKFKSGIQYKLGGIQLLLSPDIFSISEMKMYKYNGKAANKVYIGEWDPETSSLKYYGTGTTKISPNIDISQGGLVTWNHNLNAPAQYLDAKIFVRFKMQYDSFKVGDVISNITNADNKPISYKITNNTFMINLDQGIGLTNPETGEFIGFKGDYGFQMDRPGDFTALKAATQVGANIIDYGSTVASSISGGCPCQLFFMIKRLF